MFLILEKNKSINKEANSIASNFILEQQKNNNLTVIPPAHSDQMHINDHEIVPSTEMICFENSTEDVELDQIDILNLETIFLDEFIGNVGTNQINILDLEILTLSNTAGEVDVNNINFPNLLPEK